MEAGEGKGEMAVVWIEMRLAVGDGVGQVVTHGGRDDDIFFSMPEVDGGTNFFQCETPRAAEEEAIGGRAANASTQSFSGTGDESVAEVR